eukprot:601935_1
MISTPTDLSVFQLPSCSGPIANRNIPPPLPLQWQIAVPSDEACYTTRPFRAQCFESFAIDALPIIPTTNAITTRETKPTVGDDEDIVKVLREFGDCTDYRSSTHIVVNAFIKSIQKDISSIIPRDINALCISFYFVREHQLVHLAYRVYRIAHETDTFSGKELVSLMDNHSLLKDFDSPCTETVCDELFSFQVVELHSFKAYFSSLFDDPSSALLSRSSFNASDNYTYCFATSIRDIYKTFHLHQDTRAS